MPNADAQRIITAIAKAQEAFIQYADLRTLFNVLLQEITHLTNSNLGFIGEVTYPIPKKPRLSVHAFHVKDVSQDDFSFFETYTKKGLFTFERKNTVFERAIKQKKPIILQNFKKGGVETKLPFSHPSIHNFMGIPIFDHQKVVAFVGVANTDQPYTIRAIPLMQPLLKTIGMLFSAYRLRQERSQILSHLAQSEEKYRHLIEFSSDFIFLKDKQSRYVIANKNLAEYLCVPPHELIGKTDFEIMPTAMAHLCAASDKQVLRTLKPVTTQEVDKESKKVFEAYKFPVKHQGEWALGGIIRDVSAVTKAKDEIYYLNFFNPLTYLPNAAFLKEAITKKNLLRASSSKTHIKALLLIRIDEFSQLQAIRKNAYGNLCLIEVATILKRVTEEKALLCHYAEDTFAIFIESIEATSSTDAFKSIDALIQTVLQTFESPLILKQWHYYVQLNIGVAIRDDACKKGQTLIQHAEVALASAKNHGKNHTVLYSENLHKQNSGKLYRFHLLKKALLHKQFVMHYQPQINHKGEVYALEALVRWEYNDTLVFPGDFIPLIEEKGLSEALGEVVIQAVCKQLHVWKSDPFLNTLVVSINISPDHFMSKKFVRHLMEQVKKYDLAPTSIKLEITENLYIHGEEGVFEKLKSLKEAGFKISLDDFGTGYASFNYLKLFRPDELKIDQSFLKNILDNEEDIPIVQAIIQMSKALHIEVVAEGVEQETHLLLLKDLGCSLFQGYYFSKPISACDLEAFCKPPLRSTVNEPLA